MTYQELKSRLEKCEYALKSIKDGTHKNINTIDVQQTTEKLTLLKESLIKQMNALEEGNSKTYLVTPKSGQTSAVSMSDDEIDALKDADDVKGIKGVDGEEIKENVEFSIDETKAIAKKVGAAVAKSLKSLGDDVASMKARNIEVNSFEIYVQYKNGKDDEFSFYIGNNKLVLQDFTFTKELVDVGVKPSGEPIINVDVLTNELNKHFKSLEENVDEGYYDNYKPKHFDICPGAETLRKRVLDGEFGEQEPVVVGKWTELHDELFAIEKLAIKKNFAQDAHVRMANERRDEIIHLSRDMNIPEEAIGYLKGHVDKIIDIGKKSGGIKETKGAPKGHYFTKSGNLVKGRLTKDARERGARLSDPKDKQRSKVPPVTQYNEAPDDMYYIKVKRTDKASQNALQDAIETFHHPVRFADIVDDDGAGNVIFYIHKKDWDPGMEDDIMGNGVQIVDTNMPLSEGEKEVDGADTDYAKRRKEGDDYYEDPDYYKENKSEDEGGDLDIGHQDDEPDMLKQHAYDIAQYASKLYKALDKYDKYDGEVDFPNWWQSKLILARDYISKAQHYLEFEEKQPAIDQLALEGKYKSDAQRKAIYATKAEKGELKEVTEDEVQDAIGELRDLIDQIESKGEEAREVVRQVFPNELSRLDAYGAFSNMYSANRYDVTLGGFVDRLEEEGFEIEDGEVFTNEGRSLSNIKADIDKVKQLAPKINKLPQDDPKRKAFIAKVKKLNQEKKDHEALMHKKVAKTGAGQELDTTIDESTDLYDRNGIQITRFSGGKRGLMVQINYGGKYIHVPADEFATLARAMQSVIGDIRDMTLQMPRKNYPKNEAELDKKEKKQVKKIVKQLKKSVKGHGDQAKYLDKLTKEAAIPEKNITLADALERYSLGELLDTAEEFYRDQEENDSADMSAQFARQFRKSLDDFDGGVTEKAPGYKHDCASKVVHEKYGEGTCIPEKHTLVKEGNKYVVTHYDVLFENGNTVLDIPVSELEIKTQTEHWHKGYKKKKK